uniref:Uncharacterized protein n=1 Tax=Sphaeramia orbicularis TaxID=375764 RepID=A0A672YIB1_9TELE
MEPGGWSPENGGRSPDPQTDPVPGAMSPELGADHEPGARSNGDLSLESGAWKLPRHRACGAGN